MAAVMRARGQVHSPAISLLHKTSRLRAGRRRRAFRQFPWRGFAPVRWTFAGSRSRRDAAVQDVLAVFNFSAIGNVAISPCKPRATMTEHSAVKGIHFSTMASAAPKKVRQTTSQSTAPSAGKAGSLSWLLCHRSRRRRSSSHTAGRVFWRPWRVARRKLTTARIPHREIPWRRKNSFFCRRFCGANFERARTWARRDAFF